MTGHRQAWDGTLSQSTRLELDTSKMDLGRGGELTCVAVHPGGTRRASTNLSVIGSVLRPLRTRWQWLVWHWCSMVSSSLSPGPSSAQIKWDV
ncbi:hypothetical protein INR49_003444 [Caranx melampygus]|nr:hypothetical protein INR49_003444 [Caranx melampygus]